MTEFQAAILNCQLARLEEQTAKRDEHAKYLSRMLSEIPGIKPMVRHEAVTKQAYYTYVFRYDKDEFEGLHIDRFRQALHAELNMGFGGIYEPLNKCSLYRPQTKRRHKLNDAYWAAIDPARQPERDAQWQHLTATLDAELIARVVEVVRRTPTIIEVIVQAPAAARHFHPGQFYRLQNFESRARPVRPRLAQTFSRPSSSPRGCSARRSFRAQNFAPRRPTCRGDRGPGLGAAGSGGGWSLSAARGGEGGGRLGRAVAARRFRAEIEPRLDCSRPAPAAPTVAARPSGQRLDGPRSPGRSRRRNDPKASRTL